MDRTERVELTTLIMVTDSQGRMLVQDRLDPKWGGVCFPGGHVEPGESFVHAAIREMQEETGLSIEAPKLCGVKQFPIEGGRYIVFCFRTDQYSGNLRDSSEGPVFWVKKEELGSYRLSSHFMEVINLFEQDSLSELYWKVQNGDWQLFLC